jgi:hypothetical protein
MSELGSKADMLLRPQNDTHDWRRDSNLFERHSLYMHPRWGKPWAIPELILLRVFGGWRLVLRLFWSPSPSLIRLL